MEEFVIPYKGLATGNHQYGFKVEKAFFEHFDFFDTNRGLVEVKLDLEKESNLMVLQFAIDGHLMLACDRCLAEFEFPITGSFNLIVKFGEEFEEESDDVIVIPSGESRLDVSQFIFEYINLLLPIKRVHKEISECDQSVIEKLDEFSEKTTDPRWDALKNIKLK